MLSAPETYAVVLKETGEAIDSVGIMTARSELRSATMADTECEMGYWMGEPYWGQGLTPEAVGELIRYAFEDLRKTAIYCGYFDGNVQSKRVQEKCGFTYSHTEENKPVPLLNDCRTEHFTKLTLEEWKMENQEGRLIVRLFQASEKSAGLLVRVRLKPARPSHYNGFRPPLEALIFFKRGGLRRGQFAAPL